MSPIDWNKLIPDTDAPIFLGVLKGMRERNVPFALGGGFAFSAHTHRLRNTKDIDLFVQPKDRQRAIEVVHANGFTDYFEQLPYDRGWIYRGWREGLLVDVIWQMANYKAKVDEAWVTRGAEVDVLGEPVRLMPPEELIWAKLYIVQRGRCDWPDLLNVLAVHGPKLDWSRLLDRVGEDWQLLAALLSLFCWVCPQQARKVPAWVYERLQMGQPQHGPDCEKDPCRLNLLDSRNWFGPTDEVAEF